MLVYNGLSRECVERISSSEVMQLLWIVIIGVFSSNLLLYCAVGCYCICSVQNSCRLIIPSIYHSLCGLISTGLSFNGMIVAY